MELFLDSVDFNEIEECAKMGVMTGLTTTPTFMHRDGITDIDGAIVKLSGMVPSFQVEALGETVDEVINEAHRLLKLPLKNKPVFKIPISNVGVTACRILKEEGHQVNLHLVYTLNQAYMAMKAGADYICPLVGRLSDQGHDAMGLISRIVDAVNHYGYQSKVMVSSVRHADHVRQAIMMKAHACTIPWKVLRNLTLNNFTDVGTSQFKEHTALMTTKVGDVIRKENPVCDTSATLFDALVQMTDSQLGAVSIVNKKKELVGFFTDGDIRRSLKEFGDQTLKKKMSDFEYNAPIKISSSAVLQKAVDIFTEKKCDNIIVEEKGSPVGVLDIQDLVKLGLMSN